MKSLFTCIALAGGIALSAGTAQAQIYSFSAGLVPEVPGATGSGNVLLTFDVGAQTLGISALWSGLSGTTNVAHLHCCTATPGTGTVGIAVTPGTLPGFPVGVSSGSYATTLDLSLTGTFTEAFVSGNGGTAAGASAALLEGLIAGRGYFNVHSTTYAGGEIRGFPAQVPEPATWSMLALGMAAIGIAAARRRPVA